MHIVKLEAQNIKRLSAVSITPDEDASAVVLAGENEAGKSSCIDAIVMALGGERGIPTQPIRVGEEKAHVVVDLGDMIVTRRFTGKGSSLTVTNRDGLKYPSPQALLDAFYNKLTFDPMAFAGADAAKQAEILRTLAKLDTSDLDRERAMVYETRTDVNREVTRAKGALDKAEYFPDAGDTLQDAAAIVAQLDDADRLARVLAEADANVARAAADKAAAVDRVHRTERAVADARRALEEAEAEHARATQHLQHATEVVTAAGADRDQARAAVPDTSALRAQLAGVQEHNRKVDANKRRAELAEELARQQKESQRLTARLEEIDKAKADRLAAAKFPLEGLGLNDDGVTWNGLPFAQASTAIRTRVSVAIGFALNPKLKILLVRNGNDLDAKNLKLLADAVKDAGGQVWIERIAGGDGLQTIVIEDGAVRGAAEQASDATASKAGADLAPSTDATAAPGTASSSPRRRRTAGDAPGLEFGTAGATK